MHRHGLLFFLVVSHFNDVTMAAYVTDDDDGGNIEHFLLIEFSYVSLFKFTFEKHTSLFNKKSNHTSKKRRNFGLILFFT